MTRQIWPAAWLMTDERLGDALEPAMRRAAESGAGIIIRHHAAPPQERLRLAELARGFGAPLGVAGDTALARNVGAILVHNPSVSPGDLPFSRSVHNEAEALSAAAEEAALVFVSPVYPTRSHPGRPTLGEAAAVRLMKLAGCPAVALGGMDAARGAALIARGFAGWAGIDAWI